MSDKDNRAGTPQVSICLPVHNGARYLRESIESVLNQTFTSFELLISDDASTDNSFAICYEYAAKDPRVQVWRNHSRLGLFANYNQCFQRAKGHFIKPFAQDDIIHPQMLSKSMTVLDADRSIALLSVRRGCLDENSFDVSEQLPMDDAKEYIPVDVAVPGAVVIKQSLLALTNFIGEPATAIFRADALGKGFDADFAHIGDLEYWLRMLSQGGSYYFVDERLCHFRVHSGSQSARNWQEMRAMTDYIVFARKDRQIIEQAGIRTDEFIENIIRANAELVYVKWKHKLLEKPVYDKPPSASELVQQRDDLRDLAIHAMRVLDKEIKQRNAENKIAKSQIENLQSIHSPQSFASMQPGSI